MEKQQKTSQTQRLRNVSFLFILLGHGSQFTSLCMGVSMFWFCVGEELLTTNKKRSHGIINNVEYGSAEVVLLHRRDVA